MIRVDTTPGVDGPPPKVPSESQREAIEAAPEPLLVLAGPGAGKTFCLIERIRFLLETLDISPERICAFTFTNKAAGEIAERLERTLGDRAVLVRTGTIHAFCAELLREFGSRIGIERGFGVADDDYQRHVLRRIGQPARFYGSLLKRFSAHRFRGEPFGHRNDADAFERYERFLYERRKLDFDMLVIRTAELLGDPHIVQRVRARWDCVLVDEFQDLNPLQYQVVRELGREHRHIFAVGDDEQSIYSWAGADPHLFVEFINDFALTGQVVSLRENRRCPRGILALARKLVERNEQMFKDRKVVESDRESPNCVSALTFRTDDEEIAWLIEDLGRQHDESDIAWGDCAVLYRTHRIGDAIEAGLISAGIPCRLAHGRALGEDPVVAYVVAALGVLSSRDDVHDDRFLEVVLPGTLIDAARARADAAQLTLRQVLDRMARELPREHGDARKIRRAFYSLGNLGALGRRHESLPALVEELLAQRVGTYRTVLEEHHDALSDPLAHDEVVRLAERLDGVLTTHRPVWLPRMRGAEIGIEGMLTAAGIRYVSLGGAPPGDAERLDPDDAPALGLPLALFKALQLVRCGTFPNVFRDFTAIDLETTDRHTDSAEIVEIAAVRVRDGRIDGEWSALVRPSVPIALGALKTHGISDGDVAGAPSFAEVWPQFRDFCGGDVLVAHNGHQFDFPILCRMSGAELCTYDTLPLARELQPGGARLVDLARQFGIDPGASHRALDDARTLARVSLLLHEAKMAFARKTTLVNLLDHLGVALALFPGEPHEEAALFRDLCRPYSLGRYSECLEHYRARREQAEDSSLPTVPQLIEWLGGEKAMLRIRAERTASQRYPAAMARLRRILESCRGDTLGEQITQFLDLVALSRSDGADPDHERVNLLTLHSTKGLEFSRVYILGVENAQMPGDTQMRGATKSEVEEARRLLYVGMTRAKDRLVLTHVQARSGQPTGGHRFLDEMGLVPRVPT